MQNALCLGETEHLGEMSDENLDIVEKSLADLLSSPKRRLFVIAYVENGGKITAAAESAGFAHPASQGSRLLKDSKVQEAIARYTTICARVAGETKSTILDRMRNRATFDPRDFFFMREVTQNVGTEEEPEERTVLVETLRKINELTKEQAQCIKKVTWNAQGFPSIEFHDPAAADRDLARLMGLEPKENEALTPDEAASLLAAAFDRMDASEERAEPS